MFDKPEFELCVSYFRLGSFYLTNMIQLKSISTGILVLVLTINVIFRILYVSIDSNEADIGPKQDYRPHVFFFYFVYLIIIAFFMINIFVGFVIVTFQSEGESAFQDCALDKNQVKGRELKQIIKNILWIINYCNF